MFRLAKIVKKRALLKPVVSEPVVADATSVAKAAAPVAKAAAPAAKAAALVAKAAAPITIAGPTLPAPAPASASAPRGSRGSKKQAQKVQSALPTELFALRIDDKLKKVGENPFFVPDGFVSTYWRSNPFLLLVF